MILFKTILLPSEFILKIPRVVKETIEKDLSKEF